MNFLKFSLLFIFTHTFLLDTVKSECSRSSTRPLQTYIIDLDKPASDRFNEPTKQFSDEIKVLIEARKKAFNLPSKVIHVIEFITEKLDDYFPYPFNEEFRGKKLNLFI